MKYLFLTYAEKNCGVYQYGEVLYKALSKTGSWAYAKVLTKEHIDEAIQQHRPDVAVYNWHGATMGGLASFTMPRRHLCESIAVVHELRPENAHKLPRLLFSGYLFMDPTFPASKYVRPLPRCLPDVDVSDVRIEGDLPVFGSFGFAVTNKGWDHFPALIENEYDEAVLRLHIPSNWAVDSSGNIGRKYVEEIRQRVTKNTRVEASHGLLSREDMIRWLAGNTANLFPYIPRPHWGISSSADWAIAAGRPIAVSPSGLFKHLHHLPIILGHRSLREIVADGAKWVTPLKENWSEKEFIKKFYQAVQEVLNA